MAGVQRRFCQQYGVLDLWVSLMRCPCFTHRTLTSANTYLFAQRLQLVGIDVLPYPFHVVPICDYAMLQRVFDLQKASQLLRSVANENVTFQASSEHPQMFRSTNKGREEAFWQVFSRITSPDGAAPVVDNDWGIVQVSHSRIDWCTAKSWVCARLVGPESRQVCWLGRAYHVRVNGFRELE